MYIGVHKPKGVASNRGSSQDLISYLTKEEINEDGDLKEVEGFFNEDKEFIKADEAQKIIDSNSKGLKE